MSNNPKLSVLGWVEEEEYGIGDGSIMSKEAENLEIMSRQFFYSERKMINFTNRRATDYRQNTNVYFPKGAQMKQQTEIQMGKTRLLEVTKEVVEKLERVI